MATVRVQAEREFFDLEGQRKRQPGEAWATDAARVQALEERGLVKRAPGPQADKRGRGPVADK